VNPGIKFVSPATINFACFGVENLAVAIDNPANEITGFLSDIKKDTIIEEFTFDRQDKKQTKKKLEEFSIDFRTYFQSDTSVSLNIANKIGFDSGLGNFESNIVGIAGALNDLLNLHLDKNKIFNATHEICTKLGFEVNYASIASVIFGGMISYDSDTQKKIHKIYTPKGIYFSFYHSKSFKNDIENNCIRIDKSISANIVSLIYSLIVSDLETIKDSIKNNKYLELACNDLPNFKEIYNLATENGAYGTGFTTSGSSYFIVYGNTVIKSQTDEIITKYLIENKIDFKKYDSIINQTGMVKA
jgi:homoserine kinase